MVWDAAKWLFWLLAPMIPTGPIVYFLAAPQSGREWLVWILGAYLAITIGWAAIEFVKTQRSARRADVAEINAKTEGTAEQDLARVRWGEGFKHSMISNPWELTAAIEFTRHARETSCYVRWGKLEAYMSGKRRWIWSKQTTLVPPQTVHKGKVDEFVIASVPPKEPDKNFLHMFGDKISAHNYRADLICIEVVIASPEQTQSDRRYYGLVIGDRMVPVLMNVERFDEVEG